MPDRKRAQQGGHEPPEEWPTVSVVIPNLDGREVLRDCLRSLIDLDYPSQLVELIVVDNGSQDDSVEYLKANFPRAKVVENPRNLGFGAANNIGAQGASGKYVAFLNNDMRVDSRWLAELVGTVDEQRGIVCAGGKILNWNGRRVDFDGAAMNFCGYGFQLGRGRRSSRGSEEERAILFPCGGAMLIDRQLFLQVGGFDERYFAFYEDVDLGWRLWILGYQVFYAPKAIAYHRHHATASRISHEERRFLYDRNALYTIFKNYEEKHLQRILPVAILLLIKRSTLLAGVAGQGPGVVGPSLRARGRRFRVAVRRYQEGIWRAWRRGGWGGLWEAGHLQMKALAKLPSLLARKVPSTAGLTRVPKEALSQLRAVTALVDSYPQLLEQRQKIQRARRKRDEEVFPLFSLPFEPSWLNSEYIEAQRALVSAFGIDQIFGAIEDESNPHHQP